ncbi:hypothetical protein ER308_13830 [Egibacter rhizosphaerae]|uniref:Uncharacterized protein n=1 Tax=Egibacter rhizosphaerae TaxID=1670831 RepID=A0A411YHF1_9ACTN|nr:hypothetical protein ER308_13830 [Egibacter rhizosphaerae]
MEKEMRELYIEGVAIHGGPESCVGVREGVGEALAGVRVGGAIEPRNQSVRGADAVQLGGRRNRRSLSSATSMGPPVRGFRHEDGTTPSPVMGPGVVAGVSVA